MTTMPPAVVSGIEGLKAEAEASGAAVAVPPGDKKALKQAILMLMGNPSLRNAYARRATDYVKRKISWSKIAGKHMRVYKKAISQFKPKSRDLIDAALI